MAYEKQNFQDGQCLCGHHLNHIEEGIVELEKKVDNGGGGSGGGSDGSGMIIGNTSDTVPSAVITAINEGKTVLLSHTDTNFGVVFFVNFSIVMGAKLVAASVIFDYDNALYTARLAGHIDTETWDFVAEPLETGKSIPAFDLKEMGFPAIPTTGGTLAIGTDTTEISKAFSEGTVKVTAYFALGETEIPFVFYMNGLHADGVSQGVSIMVMEEAMVFSIQVIEEVGAVQVDFLPLKTMLNIPEEKITTAVDLSGFESGTIVETLSDGSTVTYSLEKDSEGNITKITDSDGNETVLTW